MISENRNTILAIVLSLVVLLGWQYFVAGPQLERQQQALQAQQEAEAARQTAAGGTQSSAPQPSVSSSGNTVAPSAGAQNSFASREQALASSTRVVIDTPRLEGSVNLTGGRLDDLRLKDYHETVDKSSPTIVLFSPKGGPNPYYADYGWVGDPGANVVLPTADTVWSIDGTAKLSALHAAHTVLEQRRWANLQTDLLDR